MPLLPYSSRRRLALLLAALPVLLVVTALLYMLAMSSLEGESRSFWRALEWASETLTTTGYGADADWRHPVMVSFVIAMQFLGVFLVYMLVPLVLLPMLEERFEMRLPRQAPTRLSGHVVIYRLGPAVETLIEELCDAGVSVLVIELDEGPARELLERMRDSGGGLKHVHVLYERSIPSALQRARLGHARALVANGNDAENASAVLVAREQGFTEMILALAEEPCHQLPLEMAGANQVITPRHVLGEALAARASLRIQPRVQGFEQLGRHMALAEVRVDPESFLAGKSLREAELGQRTGATVMGQWVAGRLEVDIRPGTRILPRGILLALGKPETLSRLRELARGPESHHGSGPLVVVGYGEVGQKVVELLRGCGEEVVVVDRRADREGVDIHDDIVDPEVLDDLRLAEAKGLVLALDADTSTLFATLTVKGRARHLPLVARVNSAENIERIYRAGADFALSISEVSARILARHLLARNTVTLDALLRVVKVPAHPFVDRHLSALDIRHKTSCSVVAVERGDEVLTRLGSDFRFQDADQIFICGSHDGIERLTGRYGLDLPVTAEALG